MGDKKEYTGTHVGGCGRNLLFDESGLTKYRCRSGGRGDIVDSNSGDPTGYKIDYAGKIVDAEGNDTGFSFSRGRLYGPSNKPPWCK